MDIQIEKYELLKWLINLEDVSEIEKTLIDSGIKEYEKGDTFSHHQVMEELKAKYGI